MRFSKLLFATWLGLHAAAAPALDSRHSHASVLDLINPAASDATWKTLAAAVGSTRFEDGLLVVGSAEAHERATARRFAHVLLRKYDFRLVLLSKIYRMTIPAFDGLIVNAAGTVVANFSMKRTFNKFNFRDSHAKISNYSQAQSWVSNLLLHQRANDIVFSSDHARQNFEARVLVLRDLAKIFGIGTDRQTWMLMEFYSGFRLEPWRVADVAGRPDTWSKHVTRLFAIDDEAFYDVKSSRVRVDALRSCEVFLRPTFSDAGESVL